jgi:C4-type Zn-finger protein
MQNETPLPWNEMQLDCPVCDKAMTILNGHYNSFGNILLECLCLQDGKYFEVFLDTRVLARKASQLELLDNIISEGETDA